jgi:hypothetical protein
VPHDAVLETYVGSGFPHPTGQSVAQLGRNLVMDLEEDAVSGLVRML